MDKQDEKLMELIADMHDASSNASFRWHEIHSGIYDKETCAALEDEAHGYNKIRVDIMYRIEKGLY